MPERLLRGPRPEGWSSAELPHRIPDYQLPAAAGPTRPLAWDTCSLREYRAHLHAALYHEEAHARREQTSFWRRKPLEPLGRCENERGESGRLFGLELPLEEKPPEQSDELHVECGEVSFVCYFWEVAPSPAGGHWATVAAHESFGNRPPYRLRLATSRTASRAQHRAIDHCRAAVLMRGRQKLAVCSPPDGLPSAVSGVLGMLNHAQAVACWTMVSHQESPPQPRTLQGPPGTGKTTVLAFSVLVALDQRPGAKVLLCAPSNEAVDVCCAKLVRSKPNVDLVRLNPLQRDPDSLPPSLEEYSVFDQSGGQFEIPDLERMRRASVVACSCSSASYIVSSLNEGESGWFTHVFVDEAAQATEPECLIPLGLAAETGSGVWLLGDFHQLGPVVRSPAAVQSGLSEPLMQRVVRQAGDELVLRESYRAHPSILRLYNNTVYQGQLKPGHNPPSAAQVCMLQHRIFAQSNGHPVLFEHVEGTAESVGNSVCNRAEAERVVAYLKDLMGDGSVAPDDIGVITPYAAQRRLLQEMCGSAMADQITIGTVHKFQGSERKVLLVSTVRSGSKGNFDLRRDLGFVADSRMANVTVSRAEAGIVVVGDMRTLSHHLVWNKIIREADQLGALHNLSKDKLVSIERAEDSIVCHTPGSVVSSGRSEPHGYVFICNNRTQDECLGRGLFGLPQRSLKHMQEHIHDGTVCLLYNRDNQTLLGPFYANGQPAKDIQPGAWRDTAGRLFPAQVKVQHGTLGKRKRHIDQANGGLLEPKALQPLMDELQRHRLEADKVVVKSFEEVMREKRQRASGSALRELSAEQAASIEEQFHKAWRHTDRPPPKLVKLWGIESSQAVKDRFRSYQQQVRDARGHEDGACARDGNTRRRFHGTCRLCGIGEGGPCVTVPCNRAECSLCCIVRDGFKLPELSANNRFGAGIYTTSTASKACDYPLDAPQGERVVIVCSVVAGLVHKRSESWLPEDRTRTAPPDGRDSIVGEPLGDPAKNALDAEARGPGDNVALQNPLNFDELVVYDAAAVLPTAFILYDFQS